MTATSAQIAAATLIGQELAEHPRANYTRVHDFREAWPTAVRDHHRMDAYIADLTAALTDANAEVQCHWMVQVGTNEDGVVFAECGTAVTVTDRGWTCRAGHSHVTIEARYAEGWDYAEDAGDAMNITRAGRQPFTMSGHVATSARDFAAAGAPV